MAKRFTYSMGIVGVAGALLSFASVYAQTPPIPALPDPQASAVPQAAPPVESLSAPVASAQAAPMEPPPSLLNDQSPKVRSLFYSPDEIMAIRVAINIYKKRLDNAVTPEDQQDEDFLNKLTGSQDQASVEKLYTYPQFFLRSIVYRSDADWVIWVNDLKITPENAKANSDIQVEAISETQVTFLWNMSIVDREKVVPIWKKAKAAGVEVDETANTVRFTLRTNQTFSSYVMRALEGEVMSVTVDLTSEHYSNSVADELLNAPATAPNNAAKKPEEGLGGLIDAYKNLSHEGDKQP